MSFNHDVENVIQVVEGVGVFILVAGGLIVLAESAVRCVNPDMRAGAYELCRRHLGRVILLGLEVLIVADIIRTVIVSQTPSSVAVLATIVIIRIALSWSLAVEIDGTWPWNRYRLPHGAGTESDQD